MGGETTVPVLSLAGIPISIPLDSSVEATTARDSRHERAMSVPDKIVFAVQYSRVKLLKRKRGELSKNPDYVLYAKAIWTPLWETRGEVEKRTSGRDEDSDKNYSEYEKYNEQSGSLDEDVFVAVMAGDGVEEKDSGEDDSTSKDKSHE